MTKNVKFKVQKVKKKYSPIFKMNVIHRRYGSLDSTQYFSCSRAKLSKIYGVPLGTLHSWIRKHRRVPGCLWNSPVKRGRP